MASRRPSVVNPHRGAVAVERLGRDREQVPGRDAVVHARLRGELLDRAGGVVERVQVPLGRLGRRPEHRPLPRADHAEHLQPRGRARLVVDEQPVGVLGNRAPQQAVVGQPARRPRHELKPGRVGVGVHQQGLAGDRVDGPDLGPVLVPGEQRQRRRAAGVPAGRHQVRQPLVRGRRRPRSPRRPARRGPGPPPRSRSRRADSAAGPAPARCTWDRRASMRSRRGCRPGPPGAAGRRGSTRSRGGGSAPRPRRTRRRRSSPPGRRPRAR